MRAFSYKKAADLQAATTWAKQGDNDSFIAGGTNLIDLMKCDIEQPKRVIDINAIALQEIKESDTGGVLLGALATNSDTAYHPLVQSHYPLLSKAILSGASPQLRNKATNGGNLLQRTRCPYFFDTAAPCNKRQPGSGCPAIEGYSKLHAIFGASDSCIAVHPSDMCVALRALDATIHIQGSEGARTIPIADFHCLPGDTPNRETVLEQGEIISHIELPPNNATHFSYFKVRERASYAFALVSVAANLQMDGEIVKEASIALGGVAAKPWRDESAEETLIGKPLTDGNCEAFASNLLKHAKSYSNNGFKIPLTRNTIKRALRDACNQPI